MDRNTIIGFILLFALFLGFSFYNSSKVKKAQAEQAVEQAKRMAEEQAEEQLITFTMDSLKNSETNGESASSAVAPEKRKPFSTLVLENEEDYVVETDVAKYFIAKKGGYITQVELKNVYKSTNNDSVKPPVILFDGHSSVMNIDVMLKDQTVIPTADYYFLSEDHSDFVLTGTENREFSFRMYPTRQEVIGGDSTMEVLDKNSYIEYLYTFSAQEYKFDFDIKFVNMGDYLYPNRKTFTLAWDAQLINMEKNYDYEKTNTSLFFMDNLEDVDNMGEKGDEKKNFTTPLKWIAFKQQFFTTVLIADHANFSSGELAVSSFDKRETHKLKEMSASLDFTLQDLDNSSFDMSMYMGPNQYKLLKNYDLDLERMVPLGWGFFLLQWINRFAIIPVFNWLESYGLNYGIIILILTIILKIILLPIAYKTYMSSAKMRVLKPEMDEINKRYPKPEDMAKKQQATMSLYKSAGVSPASGCLPMLLQMPILIAMFRFFPSAYELRQKSFLWADDLSTYDSILDFGFNIPFYGDHVSLFTLLMTISTLIYTWLNNKMMASSAGNDPSQKMMKNMMYIMPVIFLGAFNSFSAALTYYYLLVNLITFFQMWVFRVAINEDKLHAKIKANMQKPVKKSKWQTRMEELAKQQAQIQKNRK